MTTNNTDKNLIKIRQLIKTVNYFNHDSEIQSCDYNEETGEVTLKHYYNDKTRSTDIGSISEVKANLLEQLDNIVIKLKEN